MTVKKRLSRLEKRGSSVFEIDPDLENRRRGMLIFFKEIANARKEAAGEEPEPLTPEEEAFQREDRRRFHREGGLKRLRESTGWQIPEAQALLDEWERDFEEEAKYEQLQEG